MLARGLRRARRPASRPRCSTRRVVAGLGNIYVCEALHRARLSPKRKASTIATASGAPNERAERLVDAIKAVLNDAIEAGGSSLRDHRQTDGELGYFQHPFRVYDREGEPCPTPRLQGHDQAHRAERPLDVLLSGVPEVEAQPAATPWQCLVEPARDDRGDLLVVLFQHHARGCCP